jgi:uncharacterized repeat protein (TIGR03803 family)
MKSFGLPGLLAGMALFCIGATVPALAQTLTTLVTFNGSNGANPQFGALVQGRNGTLYGTTFYGGAYNQGTVFELTTSGELTTIYNFCAQNACKDGANPQSGLVLGPNGNLYGTTNGGGNYNLGTVFEITPITTLGRLTTLYNFCSLPLCGDGEGPTDSLILGPDGNLYGTTWGGGEAGFFNGTVFRLTPAGQLTTLYQFCTSNNGQWCLDGANPEGGLTYAKDGNYYGMTSSGGTSDAGVIYRVSPSGQFSTVYSFCTTKPCTNANPGATLMQSASGSQYGTSFDGNLYGTIFEFRNGVGVKTLYNFCQLSECADGYGPSGTLVRGTDGNFYGTTTSGGVHPCNGSCGTLFQITPTGALTTLYRFCSLANCADGKSPEGSLMQATDGNFYGVTYSGGDFSGGGVACLDGCGTAFRLATGLQPFVVANPSASPEGNRITILGNRLNGASVVRFNGAAATFRVVSDTEITATVPVGATSGMVTVTTPTGTLNSNIAFTVTK